ncbi:hypothetical protein BDA99DRAFT_564406 [Phascolomyces articulosus]|uniref:Uncharacterized protein n=1 Tax=Phascolomyces articulosus TaxID=60185 RepID=A0AAD5JQ98_9FUNG|nr:hypothetical protein BDA99DRAFT_564406 [Phascolomyces articulosus]
MKSSITGLPSLLYASIGVFYVLMFSDYAAGVPIPHDREAAVDTTSAVATLLSSTGCRLSRVSDVLRDLALLLLSALVLNTAVIFYDIALAIGTLAFTEGFHDIRT